MLFGLDDRIVFFGDSLTCRTGVTRSASVRKKYGENYTASYVDILLKRILVSFPETRMLAWNEGNAGNDTLDLLGRVEKDVMVRDPDWVVLFVGQNDAKQYDAATFEGNLRKLVGILTSKGARVVHLSTTPHPGMAQKNALLDSYDPVIRTVAEERGNPFVDLKSRFRRVMESNAGQKSEIELFTHGPHLSELGNILVADAVYECLTAGGS